MVTKGHRFALRFLRPLSIKKSSSFFPSLIAATSHFGFAPLPAQVSPERPRYFGGTFLPFNLLPAPRRTTAIAPPNISNFFQARPDAYEGLHQLAFAGP